LLIIQSAMHRKESRGLHFLIDYPKKAPNIKQTVFRRKRIEKNTWEIEVLKEAGNE